MTPISIDNDSTYSHSSTDSSLPFLKNIRIDDGIVVVGW